MTFALFLLFVGFIVAGAASQQDLMRQDEWTQRQTASALETANEQLKRQGTHQAPPQSRSSSSSPFIVTLSNTSIYGCNSADPTQNQCFEHVSHAVDRGCNDKRRDAATQPCGLRWNGPLIMLQPSTWTTDGPWTIFRLSNVYNVVFEGMTDNNGGNNNITAGLYFNNLSAVFRLESCSQVLFKGFAVMQLRVPYTYGVVVAPRVMAFDATRYPIDTEAFPWLKVGVLIDGYQEEVNSTGANHGYFDGQPYINMVHSKRAALSYSQNLSDFAVEVVDKIQASVLRERLHANSIMYMRIDNVANTTYNELPHNSHIVVRHAKFEFVTFSLLNVSDLVLEEVFVLSGAGQALACQACGPNIAVRRIGIIPNKGYPMSVNAGGLIFDTTHAPSSSAPTNLLVEQSEVTHTGDDTFNLNAHLNVIESVSTDRKTLRLVSTGFEGQVLHAQYRAGTELAFRNPETLETIVGISATVAEDVSFRSHAILLTAAVPKGVVDSGTLVYAVSEVARGVNITKNLFGHNVGRTLLIRGTDVFVTDNYFTKTLGPGVLAVLDNCEDFNGISISDFLFKGNVVTDCLMGPARNLARNDAAFYISANRRKNLNAEDGACIAPTNTSSKVLPTLYHNISVVHNRFIYQSLRNYRQPDEVPTTLPTIEIDFAEGVVVDNNFIERRGANPPPAPMDGKEIKLSLSTGVQCQGNTCSGNATGSCKC